MLVGMHLVVCTHFLANSGTVAVDGSDGSGTGFRAPYFSYWEYFLWLGHSAQSLELLLYHLDETKHSSTAPMAQLFASVYLMMSQAAHTTRLIASFGLIDGIIGWMPINFNVLGSRMLTFAILPGMISFLLSAFLCFGRARIGTVIEIYWVVLFSDDNYAFMFLFLAFCVAFSGTIGCIVILNSIVDATPLPADDLHTPAPAPPDLDAADTMESITMEWTLWIVDAAGTKAGGFLSFLSTDVLRYFSVALGIDEDSSGTKDQSVDARGVFWLFWLLANTYLVQGFLVGIISDNFINKQKAAEKVLLLQKLELIRCYITRQQGTSPYLSWLPLPLNILSLVYKFFMFTDLTGVAFWGMPVGRELQRINIIMAGADLQLTHDWGVGVGMRTTAAAFRVLFRLFFTAGMMLVLVSTGPTILIYSLESVAHVQTDPDWTLDDGGKKMQGKEQEKTHQEEARLLEVAALKEWREFRDDAWNDASQDARTQAIPSIV